MTGKPMTGRRRIAALVLLAGVFVMEGYDIAAMGLAVPRLHEPLGLAPTSFGWVFSALLIGLGLGGALIAPPMPMPTRRAVKTRPNEVGASPSGSSSRGTASDIAAMS